jgi:hypothetical protein
MTVPVTSIAAFKTVPVVSLRERILEILDDAGIDGLNRDEILAKFPERSRRGGTISSRFYEMERQSLVFRTNDTRPGATGCGQIVWRHHRFAIRFGVTLPTGPERDDPYLQALKWIARVARYATDLNEVKAHLIAEIRIRNKA